MNLNRKQILIVILLIISSGLSSPGFAREVLKSSPSPVPKIITVDPPQDLETCFSPDMLCKQKLVQFILNTKSSLDIAIYDLTDRDIAEAITKIAQAKIPAILIRIIVDCGRSQKTYSKISTLKIPKIVIQAGKQTAIMHDKFMIRDGIMVETGSFNYSVAASQSNQENQVYLAHPTIVSAYKKRFESMWEKPGECDFNKSNH